MNQVTFTGRWVADLELRYTQQGTAVAQGRLAVNRRFKKEGQPDADFFNIVVWGKQAENATQYTKKGSLVGIIGRLQSRSYDNKEGQKVYVTEVIAEEVDFLQPKNSDGQQQQENKDPFASNDKVIDISDEDLPF